MVRSVLMLLCLLAPGAAGAQTADWRKAGGDLFVGAPTADAEGSSDYSGEPDICTGCHQSGADYVRAFGFP